MLLQMTCSSQGDVQPWGPTEKRLNRIVFIGRNLDRQMLTTSFEACLVNQPAAAAAEACTVEAVGAGNGVTVQA
jgi:hypothetical protein